VSIGRLHACGHAQPQAWRERNEGWIFGLLAQEQEQQCCYKYYLGNALFRCKRLKKQIEKKISWGKKNEREKGN